MFCSTVIPTVGRTLLSRAVNSVLNQAFPAQDFEVIVVNDSGKPLPKEDWQDSGQVQIIHTDRRERSIARNTGAAVARGTYLHFLDDDDWLLPGALKNFWELAQKADQAVWLYGGTQLVDRQGKPLIELHNGFSGNCFIQAMAGEWFPIQSSLICSKPFFDIGGFNSKLACFEDIDICRRVALQGDFAETDTLVACIGMGSDGSTTDRLRRPQASRLAREEILSMPGAFSRMRASANGGKWQGRITRIYLTSLLLNLQNRRISTAASRAGYGFASLALAAPYLISRDFWRSVFRNFVSESFTNGFSKRLPVS